MAHRRILICGSRDFTDREFFFRAMEAWMHKHGVPAVVVEGCARGADTLAEQWVLHESPCHMDPDSTPMVTLDHYPADWDRHGKAAGHIRNTQMLREGLPSAVIAFTRDLSTSRGTANMVRQARAAGIPVWLPVAGTSPAALALRDKR